MNNDKQITMNEEKQKIIRYRKSRVKQGINDFETWCKTNNRLDLILEWDNNANGLYVSEVAYGSHKVYKWICSICNNQFESNIPNRRFGNNCPYCSNQKVMSGMNDFETFCHNENKEYLLDEWDYEKNDIEPTQITKGSIRKVFWLCKECKNSYDSTISHRLAGRSCPFCKEDGRKRVCAGLNDFETYCKENDALYLLEEWDYEKNECRPSEITYGSTKLIWWKCLRCGNSFKLLPSKRRRGDGCPECSKYIRTSFNEQAILFYISKEFPDVVSQYREDGLELDIYIPCMRVAIEYDGQEWHKDIDRDLSKIKLCNERNIMLINVREPKCPQLDEHDRNRVYVLESLSEHSIEKLIDKLIYDLSGNNIDININKDRFNIYERYLNISYKKSVAYLYPEAAEEWDIEANNGIGPERFPAGSARTVAWKCKKCGSSYKKAINQKVKGSGCPYCSNRKIILGKNDLCTTRPEIAKEWNYQKNGDLKPTDVTYGCDKKVWWICAKKHEWQAPIYTRSKGVGCPFCSNRYVMRGYNDLESMYPDIAKQWNYEKNGDLKPCEVSPGSKAVVWWIGLSCNHTFQQPIYNKVKREGCLVCASRQGRIITKLETGEKFTSLTEAAKSCGKNSQSSLLKCIQGEGETAYGFHWKSEIDENYLI